jgi:hypothetical protein
MKHQHMATLQALFAHPVPHNLRQSSVESLLIHLGGSVHHLSEHRLKLQLSNGNSMVLHAAGGPLHPDLDAEGIHRIRWFLEQAGITPDHPEAPSRPVRGEQAKRLLIHLDHRGARLWWLNGDDVKAADLRPHGLWSSGQRLSHRHDRDVKGQRAPLDYDYLKDLSAAIADADRVLLLGHGHGQSDLRQLLTHYIGEHHPELHSRLETISVDDTACSDAELLALAHRHFGNQPHRHELRSPGQRNHERSEPR